jgi:peptidoglycan/xylan/chitin deacetylase (PgdA/CDA1 family)
MISQRSCRLVHLPPSPLHLPSLRAPYTMANTRDESSSAPRWPNGARAAMVLTIDNMGEAADLDRNLWPKSAPIGEHYSVTKVIPRFLDILARHDIAATYFIESWNLGVYPSTIRTIADAGHEVAWHAWRHEAWDKIKDETRERANFARSFGEEGLQGFINNSKQGEVRINSYKGFRPPGGIIHGQRTLDICK